MMRRIECVAAEAKTGMYAIVEMAELAAAHYETSAPVVSTWADDFYSRLTAGNGGKESDVREILCLLQLHDDGQWEQPNYAANRVYKLLTRLGRDTTGMAGF